MKWTSRNGRLSCLGCLLVLPWLFMLVLIAGCPIGGNGNNNGNGNGNDNNGGSGAGEIITPASSFGLSLLDPPFQVRYNVPESATNVQGYRFPVADSTLNSPSTGDPVVTASGLVAGDNQFFDFDPFEAGVGYFRVGVSFTLNGDADFAESSGVIQVQGSPDPIFVQPASDLTIVEEGSVLTVSFDCRDPENQVQWRLFFLDSDDNPTAPPDQVGTQLAVGSGNAGSVSFRTEGLSVGDYILGLSATDSGMSISGTVAAGELDRIVTIPKGDQTTPVVRVVSEGTNIVPTITITNPAGTDIELFKDESFTIEFTATVPQAGLTGTVEVFYDTDTNVNNGFTLIEEDLPHTATEVEWPAGVPEGEYFVGATIRDGVNAAVTDYSAGKVIVVRTVTVTVTEPDSSLAVTPNTPVAILWDTNAPDDAGTVDVFAQRLTSAGTPTGPVIPIITAGAMTLRTATFSSTTTGLFRITVRLNLTEGNPVSGNSPRPVRVSTLPAVAWLGAIAESEPRIDGAIFGGVNFEDNAGSSFAKADDLDGDGLNEFVIGARYAKPFFINPSGIGPGEAYVLYGERGASRLTGTFNLNSTGTSSLRGVTLTGVRTLTNANSQTDGLADITSIPNVDGDGKEELAFGFPFVSSGSSSALDDGVVPPTTFCGGLAPAPQFRSGGVVILSSENSIFEDPSAGSPVINLDAVGQEFTDESITPNDIELVFDDQCQFDDGVTDCIDGTDNVFDTVIGPNIGFSQQLARPQWAFPQFGFVPICGSEVDEEVCPTKRNVEECGASETHIPPTASGSGFFPAASQPSEPFGARIIGASNTDEFGTSISLTNSTGSSGPGELIISSPEASDGISYVFPNTNLWGGSGTRPKPHQYVIDTGGYFGDGRSGGAFSQTRLLGDSGDMVENSIGIDDFNIDGRDDLAVGAPLADFGNGRVYIAYRREPGFGGLEGNFELSKLGLSPDSPERLEGLLISTTTFDGLGSSLAEGFDFNGDGLSDIAIGSPDAGTGTGEVIIVFGGTGIISPAGGITVQALLTQTRTAEGGPVAVRIRGATTGGEAGYFGFNIANVGDIDGDDLPDLAIAAPHASPRFDSDPNDGTDQLNTLGVDMDLNGVRDQVPGDDELRQAGLVYVILGKNRLDQIRTCQGTTQPCSSAAQCPGGAACTLTDPTLNIDQLGTSRLNGFIIAGRRSGDFLGGGDAGDTDPDIGNPTKEGRGRSQGLGAAGDVDGDGRDDILIGSLLADPRRDPNTGTGVRNGGEAFLFYGSNVP